MAVAISELADATVRIKTASASHVGWPLAAMKAIEAKGIRHKPDVKRLTSETMKMLRARGTIPARSRKN